MNDNILSILYWTFINLTFLSPFFYPIILFSANHKRHVRWSSENSPGPGLLYQDQQNHQDHLRTYRWTLGILYLLRTTTSESGLPYQDLKNHVKLFQKISAILSDIETKQDLFSPIKESKNSL